MNKYDFRWRLVAISVALAFAAGCYTIEIPQVPAPPNTPKQSQQPTVPSGATSLPAIISFTASPTSIIAGQPVVLSWETSGAMSVIITPDIGAVSSSGTRQVSPSIQTIYTLTVSDGTASVPNSITVMVRQATLLSDLVITNMWTTGKRVYYVAKNQGAGKSELNEAHFYINDYDVAFSYIQPLDPGQERVEAFEAYIAPFDARPYPYPYLYPYPYPYPYQYQEYPMWNVKVCADVKDVLLESNKSNNCMEQVWGETWGNQPSYVK